MESQEEILNGVKKDMLLEVASSLAGGLTCQLDSGPPVMGSGYVLLILHFPDNDNRWVARIPLDQEYPFLDSCVEPLEYVIRNHPRLPVPRIHGYSDTIKKSPVGVAYIMLDWIEGTPLQPWDLLNPPVPMRHKVMDQIADLMLDMITANLVKGITFYGVPDGTPKDTPVTTTTWLTESVDRGLRRALLRNMCDTAIDYLIQRSIVPRYVVPEYENSPWVVVHGDLHNSNIIVDEDFNLRGVIDWDFTFATPLQKAATFPKLLANVPGGAPPSLPGTHAYLDLSDDKSYFLATFSKKEKQRTNRTSIAKLIETSSDRNFFEMSLHRPPVHEEFVMKFCSRTHENILAALTEVDKFLATKTNVQFDRNDQVVADTISRLQKLERECALELISLA